MVNLFFNLGLKSKKILISVMQFFNFVGGIFYKKENSHLKRRIQWEMIILFLQRTGVNATPIVLLLSFLIGSVLIYQSINQLEKFGAETMSVSFLGIAVFREISSLITAIIVAGRTGSSFTAQIGVMKMNQEIDAIKSFGLDPVSLLAVPRIISLIISLPILTFISMIAAVFGGYLLSSVILDISFQQFFSQLQIHISINHFYIGMSKSPIFAIIIGLISCFRGFSVEKTSESLGKMTTKSVVDSIFLIVLWDAIFSVFCSSLGY